MIIGCAKLGDDGFWHLLIRTATLDVEAMMVPNSDKLPDAPPTVPDFVVLVQSGENSYEAGAAWVKETTPRVGENRRPQTFFNIRFDSPEQPAPWFCSAWLVRGLPNQMDIIWKRQK